MADTEVFFLFRGRRYYPHGGASDFLSAHPSMAEAQAAAGESQDWFWEQIARWDGTNLTIVCDRWDKEWEDGAWHDRR